MQIRASIPIAGWAGMRTGSSAVRMPWPKSVLAGGVGRRAAEDALGAHGVELAELDAVGERAQVDVVDQHRAARAGRSARRRSPEARPPRPDHGSHHEPVAHRVLGHDPRLDELQQVVGAARLRAGAATGGCRRTAGGRPSRR